MEFLGKLFTGLGEGRYYILKDEYKEQFVEKLGFDPFPGTLNIRLNERGVLLRGRLSGMSGIKILGFKSGNTTFGDVKCFNASIRTNNRTLSCAIIILERTSYQEDVLEVIAPVNLRHALGVKDGDELRVKVIL
jgi:riboflavin kinase